MTKKKESAPLFAVIAGNFTLVTGRPMTAPQAERLIVASVSVDALGPHVSTEAKSRVIQASAQRSGFGDVNDAELALFAGIAVHAAATENGNA